MSLEIFALYALTALQIKMIEMLMNQPESISGNHSPGKLI